MEVEISNSNYVIGLQWAALVVCRLPRIGECDRILSILSIIVGKSKSRTA